MLGGTITLWAEVMSFKSWKENKAETKRKKAKAKIRGRQAAAKLEGKPWANTMTYLEFPVCPKSLQLCSTLCHPMDCSLPGSSGHGILQTRILEWIVMPSSRGSFQPRDWTCVSYISCIGRFHTKYYLSWLQAAVAYSRVLVPSQRLRPCSTEHWILDTRSVVSDKVLAENNFHKTEISEKSKVLIRRDKSTVHVDRHMGRLRKRVASSW